MKLSMAVFALSTLLASTAMAADAQDTVTNKSDTVVTSSSGSCVRTKWTADDDVCAPKPKPVAEVPPPPPAPIPAPIPSPQEELISLDKRTIYFDFDKDTITPTAQQKLEELVTIVQQVGVVKSMKVVGYTDVMGSDSYNDALSQHRADNVRAYLATKLNIPSDSEVRGLGKSMTAECSTIKKRSKRIECLGPDRRVEVEMTYGK